MKQRNPIMVIILTLITLGVYGLVWFVRSKNEMNTKGAQIPTAWLLIIPVAGIIWLWKFAKGVEMVTRKSMGVGTAFCLLFFLGMIGMAIVQGELNKVSTGGLNMSDQWYLHKGGNQYGPYRWEELTAFAREGRVEPGDNVWNSTMAAWAPAAAVAGLMPHALMYGPQGRDAAFQHRPTGEYGWHGWRADTGYHYQTDQQNGYSGGDSGGDSGGE